MLRRLRLGIVLAVVWIQVGFGPAVAEPAQVQKPGMLEVTGEITYRERIAIPPQSVAVVTLRDVPAPNSPSMVIAEQRIDLAGRQVPIPFRITVDRAKMLPQRKYSIRGTIYGPLQQTLWTTGIESHLVDSSAPSVKLGTLVMTRVTGDAADPEERLRAGEWTVVKLNGVDVPAGSRGTLTFGANAALSGRSFCNSFIGTYALAGGTLSLSPKASTLMACPQEIANMEKLFMQLLAGVQRFEISEGGTLTLRTSDLRTITASRT